MPMMEGQFPRLAKILLDLTDEVVDKLTAFSLEWAGKVTEVQEMLEEGDDFDTVAKANTYCVMDPIGAHTVVAALAMGVATDRQQLMAAHKMLEGIFFREQLSDLAHMARQNQLPEKFFKELAKEKAAMALKLTIS